MEHLHHAVLGSVTQHQLFWLSWCDIFKVKLQLCQPQTRKICSINRPVPNPSFSGCWLYLKLHIFSLFLCLSSSKSEKVATLFQEEIKIYINNIYIIIFYISFFKIKANTGLLKTSSALQMESTLNYLLVSHYSVLLRCLIVCSVMFNLLHHLQLIIVYMQYDNPLHVPVPILEKGRV